LRPGDIVVLDNLGGHKEKAARDDRALWKRIGELVDRFPQAECQSYIANAGYRAPI
jgi:hypothetical protein